MAERRWEGLLQSAGPLPIVGLLFLLAGALVLVGGRANERTRGTLGATVADLKPVHAGVSVGGMPAQWLRRVAEGDRVATNADGRARLRLDDGTTLILDRESSLVLSRDGFRLIQGRAHVTSPVGAHPRVELSGLTVLPSGGSAGLETRGERVSVFSPDSELAVKGPGGREIHVNAGETARLAQGVVSVTPERAYDDWTHGLARPWAARGVPRRALGELWGSVEGASLAAGSVGAPLTIRAHQVDAKLDRELARTSCRTTFFNAGSSAVTGDFRVALPPGALVSGFAIERGGSREEARIALASRKPEQLSSTAAVLEWAGDGWLRGTLPAIASGEELVVEVQYVEWLPPRRRGARQLLQYRYPLVGDGEPPLIGDFVARVDARGVAPTAVAAGYGASSDSGVVTVHRADFRPSADLVVDVETQRSSERARLYVAPPTAEDPEGGSAVLLRAELPEAAAQDGVTLTLVVDTSGSIEGGLLDAERALVDAVLAGLGDHDRVLVLAADQTLSPVGPATLGPVDAARRKQISAALGSLSSGGATDLGRALEAAADALPADAPSALVVYIGDGWATLGDSSPEAMSARLSRRKLGAPRLGAVAVGPLANRRVLSALTHGTGPLYEVADSEDAGRVAIELLSDALRPALAGVEVDLGPEVDQVYPRVTRAIAMGETLTTVGRVRGSMPKAVTLRYRDARGSHEETRQVDLLRASDVDDVRRRWAAARVEELVLARKGREAATDVALRAGLVTPWTGLRIGGADEYVARPFQARVLDLASDGASVVGPVLATQSDLKGTLSAFDLEIASAADFSEALTQAAGRLLSEAAPSVRACRDSRAALRPELSGALEVALTIDGDGLPHDVKVRGGAPSADDAALNRCVQLVVEALRFPTGGSGRVKVTQLIQLPPPPTGLGARHCSDVSRLPMPLRRGAWWTRLTQKQASEVYAEAKRQCELGSWTDRRALLELMLTYLESGSQRVALASELDAIGEADAATLVRREAIRRVASPEELTEVRRALLGTERYPGSLFEQRYTAATNDKARLEVLQQFLQLAPHDSRLRRQLLALLEAMNRKPEVIELARQLRMDPFADALLLADAGSALHQVGADAEARRTFGELSERAPADPWVRGLLGDRLRSEAWFDEASDAYATLADLVPEDARATLRQAMAHAGAGRLDIAQRLLARVARTGGRNGSAELGELARQLARVWIRAALASTTRPPNEQESTRLRRMESELTQGDDRTALLIQAAAGAPELKVRLQGEGADKLVHEPDVEVGGLGLYLFYTSSNADPAQLMRRLRLSGPSALPPARPLRVRLDVVPPAGTAGLATREVSLPNDGKELTPAP